ncbi:response regulator transcription factor [Acidithiobacillus sulfuriphilus]|uniref:Response regulator transcription factor n=1 Tax=Acidithiobacillus sulfuriphilus TaxID=1867749 RepID=A0ACD5HRH0_9PROT|nr:response regulator transcription factor [Acidithiobacillus sulfuriphilus]
MTTSPVEVLIIEDDQSIADFLQTALGHEPYYQVRRVGTLRDAWREMEKRLVFCNEPFSVLLLDLGIPDGDGQDFITKVRAQYADGPFIIVISARNNETDKIKALDAGADDYLTKPFTIGELLARMRAHLRRRESASMEEGHCWRFEDLEIDDNAHTVKKRGEKVALTPTEFRLLRLLAEHYGSVLSHRRILSIIWGGEQ